MDSIYNEKAWAKDGTFSAKPGQQVSEAVYEQMFNCLPPYRLSNEAVDNAAKTGVYVSAGFMVSEPTSSDHNGLLYNAFGRNGKTFYYLGTAHKGGQ